MMSGYKKMGKYPKSMAMKKAKMYREKGYKARTKKCSDGKYWVLKSKK